LLTDRKRSCWNARRKTKSVFASTGSDTLEDVHVQASSERSERERERERERRRRQRQRRKCHCYFWQCLVGVLLKECRRRLVSKKGGPGRVRGRGALSPVDTRTFCNTFGIAKSRSWRLETRRPLPECPSTAGSGRRLPTVLDLLPAKNCTQILRTADFRCSASFVCERERERDTHTHTEESRHRHAERRERRWGCVCEALDEGESGSSGDVEEQGELETVREGRCDHVRRHRFRVVVGFQFSSRLVDAQTPH
jgi:hypothetical protein